MTDEHFDDSFLYEEDEFAAERAKPLTEEQAWKSVRAVEPIMDIEGRTMKAEHKQLIVDLLCKRTTIDAVIQRITDEHAHKQS